MASESVLIAEGADSVAESVAICTAPAYRELFDHLGASWTEDVKLDEKTATLVRRTLEFADETRFDEDITDPEAELSALSGRLAMAADLCAGDPELLLEVRYRQASVSARAAWLRGMQDPGRTFAEEFKEAFGILLELESDAKNLNRQELLLVASVEIARYACSAACAFETNEEALENAIRMCSTIDERLAEGDVDVERVHLAVLVHRETRALAKAALGRRLIRDAVLLREAIGDLEELVGGELPEDSLETRWRRNRPLVVALLTLGKETNDAGALERSREVLEALLRPNKREVWANERHWLEARSLYGDTILYLAILAGDLRALEIAANVLSDVGSAEVLEAHPDLWLDSKVHWGLALQRLGEACENGELLREAQLAYEGAATEGKKRNWVNTGIAEQLLHELDPSKFDKAVATEEQGPAHTQNLTSESEMGDDAAASATKEEDGEIDESDEPPENTATLRDPFAEASLGELEASLVPAVPQGAMERLEELIREAQEEPPADKAYFVETINRILDARNLRLQVDGEEHLARLWMNKGSISLAIAGGRGQKGFRRKTIRVVAVPETYGLRGARPG